MPHTHAVVVVSGGAAISPFTTPDRAARTGLAAGSTDTALRAALLEAGRAVFTSPATVGGGIAERDTGFAGFDDAPDPLPEHLTVDAAGDIDEAGVRLAAFLEHLAEHHDVSSVDLVGHSMGGLFSRSAIRRLAEAGWPVGVRRLVTIGTPWLGSFGGDYAAGHLSILDAMGDVATETAMREMAELRAAVSHGAGEEVTRSYLGEPGGWNDQQSGALDAIPVTLIGGDHFRHADGPDTVWPHDGLVSLSSALATGVRRIVLPHRRAHAFPDVHSIYVADRAGLPWTRALTWDPEVLAVVVDALASEE